MSPKEKTKLAGIVELIKDGRGNAKGVAVLGVNGFARATRMSPALVTRYMQGKIGEPTTATLQKLADYFGVSVAYLRGEETDTRGLDPYVNALLRALESTINEAMQADPLFKLSGISPSTRHGMQMKKTLGYQDFEKAATPVIIKLVKELRQQENEKEEAQK